MAVLEITLTPDYVENWGVWEGVREMVQNAKDGEIEHGAEMSVHMTSGGTLVIENEGVTIPRESLLIGFSSKRNDSSQMGQFGEGLKLGTLALVRSGYTVRIRNGKELWKPSIQHSERFNSKVLAFHCTKARGKGVDGVRVEIDGIGAENWDKLKTMFLFLQKPEKAVDTLSGSVLLDDKYSGLVFVKGIFVEKEPRFRYGYNLKSAAIDRDRRMVNRFDLRWEAGRIWALAVNSNPELIGDALNLLKSGSEEVEMMHSLMTQDVSDKVADEFVKENGENAVPVQQMAESKEIEHYGYRGVVVPEPFAKVLERKFGNFDQMKSKLANQPIEMHSWSDLDSVEKKTLEMSIEMLAKAGEDATLADFDVVTFNEDSVMGRYEGEKQKCMIGRKVLGDLEEALVVVVHEWCHKATSAGDGSMVHSDRVERVFARIVMACLEGD